MTTLNDLKRLAIRDHYYCEDDCHHTCPKAVDEKGETYSCNDQASGVCNCGADNHNEKVERLFLDFQSILGRKLNIKQHKETPPLTPLELALKTLPFSLERLNQAKRIAEFEALKSECQKAQVGCTIFDVNGYVAFGHNSDPATPLLCDTVNCQVTGKQDSNCAKVHAEITAIRQLKHVLRDHTQTLYIYCTHFPCLNCTHRIEETGIRHVFYTQSNGWKTDVCKHFPNIEFIHVP